MKAILLAALFTVGAQAATIHSVTYNSKNDSVTIDLTYGGCHLETFRLSFGECAETMPYQVTAKLDDKMDVCRAIIRTKIERSVSDVECRPALLTVTDGHGFSRAQVELP